MSLGLGSACDNAGCYFDRLVNRPDLAVQLSLINLSEDSPHLWSRLETQSQDVTAEEHWSRWMVLHAQCSGSVQKPVHGGAVEITSSSEAVGLGQTGQ